MTIVIVVAVPTPRMGFEFDGAIMEDTSVYRVFVTAVVARYGHLRSSIGPDDKITIAGSRVATNANN